MKKSVFLFFTLIVLSFSVNAQSIKQDISFLKITNYLWYVTSLSQELVAANQSIEKRNEIIPIIRKLEKCLKEELIILENKYPYDPDLEKVKSWITGTENNIKGLESEEWRSKPVWQMFFYLVQLDLQDIINKELCE